MKKTTDTIIVCYDWTNGEDKAILAVGRKKRGQDVDVINAIHGKEAEELYKKLIERKEDKKE